MGENNLKKRIRNAQCREKIMSAEEAASFIRPGMAIGSSGFTPAGYPKMIPAALAKRAEAGEKLDLTLLTGASTGLPGHLDRRGRGHYNGGAFHGFSPKKQNQGSSDEIGKSWRREILFPGKVWKVREYFLYFPLFIPQSGSKRSAVQPQTIYSEFP